MAILTRSCLRWALVLVMLLGSHDICMAGAQAAPRSYEESQVKAAFLYNFTKFVDWPADSFPDPDAPVLIGILGEDPIGRALEGLIKARVVNGRKTAIKRFKTVAALEPVHLLFVSASVRKQLPLLFKALEGHSVLTVSDMEGFAQQGGVINLVIRNQRLGFEINEDAAQRANLKISSKLLKLAKVVKDKEGGH